jgi:predicted PurR-regulated permease PerM
VGGFFTKQSLITGILTGIAVLLPGIGTIFVVITSIVAAVFLSYKKNKDETISK